MAEQGSSDARGVEAALQPDSAAPRVYMMCGLPFSGKSTLARALASRFGWNHLELDQFHTERGVGTAGTPISRQQWTAAYREAFQRLDQLLTAGNTVIYDATNFRRVQREQVRRIAARHGARASVIHVAVPEAVTRRRLLANRLTRHRLDVRDEDFAEVAMRFQPPTDAELVLRYDQQVPLDHWLALVVEWPVS